MMTLSVLPLSASEVRIETNSAGFHTLLRNGEPFLVKGANWPTASTVGTLVTAGGNSIRTYGDEIEWMLPLAKKHHLTLMIGLNIGRERQGFDYTHLPSVEAQRVRIRKFIKKYKGEPELFVWAIGNEPEMNAKQTVPLWKEVNEIAKIIHEEDPHHPVITVIAGFDQRKIQELLEHCPNLDALGVNWYGPAKQWPENLKKFGWSKPYFLTEFGPTGYWPGAEGGGQTEWGAPLEQDSTTKAKLYTENWQNAVLGRPGQSLGAYAFIWCFKQERTPTWFSMILKSGERTALVDALQEAWTEKPVEHPAPEILEWKPERANGRFQKSESIPITLRWKCNRPTQILVETLTESTATQVGGDQEPEPELLPQTQWTPTDQGIQVTAPSRPGKYRIFVTITTKDRTAATANLPILVTE